MIVVRKRFRTVVASRNGIMMRVCTGTELPEICNRDDIDYADCKSVENSLCICSRKDVYKAAKFNVILSALFAIIFFLAMLHYLWEMYASFVTYGGFHLNVDILFAAASALFFVFMFRQFTNPIVHDNDGHWVNLRTGSSNLCGGIVIKGKARWP